MTQAGTRRSGRKRRKRTEREQSRKKMEGFGKEDSEIALGRTLRKREGLGERLSKRV